jgi:DNA invertase Pin-like site-specific DNA recombinase
MCAVYDSVYRFESLIYGRALTVKRVAIYARVSTDDKGQDPENQLTQLRAWCASAGYEIVGEYVDRESGRKGIDKRKRFNELFEDASRRKFDLVLFWTLDRFSREGMVPTVNCLQRLSACGVAFHSYTESHLSTDNELVRNVLLAVMSSLAKVEAEKISERVKAGLQRAVAKGKTLGRPRIDRAIESRVRKMLGDRVGMLRIAAEFDIGSGTVQRIAREMRS